MNRWRQRRLLPRNGGRHYLFRPSRHQAQWLARVDYPIGTDTSIGPRWLFVGVVVFVTRGIVVFMRIVAGIVKGIIVPGVGVFGVMI